MIYLIGGPPKCGKTTLAKSLSKKTGISWMSADTIQNIVWALVSVEERKNLFPRSFLRGDTNDESYTVNTVDEIIESYQKQAEASYEAMEKIIETYLIDKDDFIIEGYQVTPAFMHAMQEKFGSDHIRSTFLVRLDPVQFIADIPKSTTPNDWIIRRTEDTDVIYPKIAEMVVQYGKWFEEEAEKYDLVVRKMDVDFEGVIDKILDSLIANS